MKTARYEWQVRDERGHRLAAHYQRHLLAFLGEVHLDITHGYRTLDRGAIAAAGDLADAIAVAVGDFGMLAGRRAAERRAAEQAELASARERNANREVIMSLRDAATASAAAPSGLSSMRSTASRTRERSRPNIST